MAPKSHKTKKDSEPASHAARNKHEEKSLPNPKKGVEDDDDDFDEDDEPGIKTASKKPAHTLPKKSKAVDGDDDDDEVDDTPDEWEKPVEEEEWDPDFDEFDIPKSLAKKTTGGKKAADDDDDFKIDKDFKEFDLFNDNDFDDDDDDDL